MMETIQDLNPKNHQCGHLAWPLAQLVLLHMEATYFVGNTFLIGAPQKLFWLQLLWAQEMNLLF